MDIFSIKKRIERVQEILFDTGFKDTLLQERKPGQVFGVVKDIEDVWQMHVRGFENGHLESELELHRRFLEHLDDDYRRSASNELIEILDSYGMPYQRIGTPLKAINVRMEPPETLTDWRALVFIFSLMGLATYYFVKKDKKHKIS